MASPPNILWVVTTQWRAQACGFAGDPNARTPVLDRLASASVNYAEAVTPHPFGPFARAALLTGRRSPGNGITDYFDPLPSDARTIAHDLDERGYVTAYFGKWHLGERDREADLVGEAHAKTIVPVAARGSFSFWEGFESGFQLNDPWLHGTRLDEPTQFSGYQSDVLCERAARWLGEQRGSPWFAVVSLESPHPPYHAPAAGIAAQESARVLLRANVPDDSVTAARARSELAGYYAHIEATDRAIARLLAATNAAATIVVFTSVHGDMHGAHGLFRKGWPHEESIRVPLLVRGTGMEPMINRSAISLVDLRRLSMAWADGVSPAIEQTAAWISMPSVVALPCQCDRVWRGARTSRRKLVLNADGSPWLFFDLENDPLEMKNLAGDPRRACEIENLRLMVDGFSESP